MRRVSIERYDNPESVGYSGLIEGTRDDGTTWIMWLDTNGSPCIFWPTRDEGGGIWGTPTVLPPREQIPGEDMAGD